MIEAIIVVGFWLGVAIILFYVYRCIFVKDLRKLWPDKCVWTKIDNNCYETFNTSCGMGFCNDVFLELFPLMYCPHCGRKIEIKKAGK